MVKVKLPAIEPEADAVSLLIFPLAAMGGAAVVLMIAGNLLKLIASASIPSWATGKGELGKTIQPAAAFFKRHFEQSVMPISSYKVSLEHILLTAILITMVGIWRNTSRSVAVAQKQAQLLALQVGEEESEGRGKSKSH